MHMSPIVLQQLPAIRLERVPQARPLHVAIISDGNGRWATSRGLPRSAGHRAGAQTARRIIGAAPSLGIHTLTTLREPRAALIGRLGEGPYKGLYSVVSAIGLVLIVWGFARYRDTAYLQIWAPPAWLHPVVLVLMWLAFVALAAAYSPPGWIKGALRHPMLVGIKSWALAHLLANGDLGALILFGTFLAWRRR